jgi:ADP-ribosylglycohydrolase
MALCLADSLLACNGFDARDQMERYVRWYREGHRSSTGVCFDIGGTTRAALEAFERTGEPFAGSDAPASAGNGSIMRLAPVALRWAYAPADAVALAARSSRTTHAAREAVDACRYFAGLIVGALAGESREKLLLPMYVPGPDAGDATPLAPRVAQVAAGSFRVREPPAIRGSGYVVESLEAALWAFARARDFRHGALLAANLGNDADTTAAVYGQLAGAYFGAEAIPRAWLDALAQRDEIERLALALMQAAAGTGSNRTTGAGS